MRTSCRAAPLARRVVVSLCDARAPGARRSARAAGSVRPTFLRAICILNLGARASAGKLPGRFQRISGGCLLAYSESPVVVSISARTAWERYFTERYTFVHPRPRRTRHSTPSRSRTTARRGIIFWNAISTWPVSFDRSEVLRLAVRHSRARVPLKLVRRSVVALRAWIHQSRQGDRVPDDSCNCKSQI